jgi:succinyl-CoA synthetase alpha subunit
MSQEDSFELRFIRSIRECVDYYRNIYTSCEKRIHVDEVSFVLELKKSMELHPSTSISIYYVNPESAAERIMECVQLHKRELLELFDAETINSVCVPYVNKK